MPAEHLKEEEEFEEDTLFDQAGLLTNKVRPRAEARNVSGTMRITPMKTFALCLAFFGLGLSFSILEPTLLELQQLAGTDVQSISYTITARALGYIFGSAIGILLFDRYNRQFLLFLSMLGMMLLIGILPWCHNLVAYIVILFLLGILMQMLYAGGNVLCLDLWGRQSGPFLQAIHFSLALGFFLAPLLCDAIMMGNPSGSNILNLTSSQPIALPASSLFGVQLSDYTRRPPRDVSDQLLQDVSDQLLNGDNLSEVYQTTMAAPAEPGKSSTIVSMLLPARNTTPSAAPTNATIAAVNMSGGTKVTVNSNTTSTATSVVGTVVPDANGTTVGSENSTDSMNATLKPPRKPKPSITNADHLPKQKDKWDRPAQHQLDPPATKVKAIATTVATTSPAGNVTTVAPDNSTVILTNASSTNQSAQLAAVNATSLPAEVYVPSVGPTPPVLPNVTVPAAVVPTSGGTVKSSTVVSIQAQTQTGETEVAAPESGTTSITGGLHSKTLPTILPSPQDVVAPVVGTGGSVFPVTGGENESDGNQSSEVFNNHDVPGLDSNTHVPNETATAYVQTTTPTPEPLVTVPPVELYVTTQREAQTAHSVVTTRGPIPPPTIAPAVVVHGTSTVPSTSNVPTASSEKLPRKPLPSVTNSDHLPKQKDKWDRPTQHNLPPVKDKDQTTHAQPKTSATPGVSTSSAIGNGITDMSEDEKNITIHHKPSTTFNNETDDSSRFVNDLLNKISEMGVTKVHIVYIVMSVIVLLTSLVFLSFLCHNPRELRSKQEEGVKPGVAQEGKFTSIMVGLTFVMVIFYTCAELVFSQLYLSLVWQNSAHLLRSRGSLLISVFWGVYAFSRGTSICCTNGFKPSTMILVDFACCVTSAATLAVFGSDIESVLWCSMAVMAIGLSSIFPYSLLWLEEYINVSNKTACTILFGSSSVNLVVSLMYGHPVNLTSAMVIYLVLACCVFALLIFGIMWRLATWRGDKYGFSKVDVQYQLASQVDEEEDSFELTPGNSSLYLLNNGNGHSSTNGHASWDRTEPVYVPLKQNKKWK